MSNQHKGKPSFHTCLNPECKNRVRTTPSITRKGSGKYCSPKCGWKCKERTKYPQDTIAWLKKHILHVPMADIAEMIGVTQVALRRAITKMRMDGYMIPTPGIFRIGEIRTRTYHGKEVRSIKTEIGWRHYTPEGTNGNSRQIKKGGKPKQPATRTIAIKPDVKATEPAVIFKTRIPLPGGGFVECDSDKVDATIRYLLKSG